MLVRLKTYPDNREFACTFTGPFNTWSWIADCVAERFECDPDDVATLDTDDELDLITVRGEPVARIQKLAGWDALGIA